MSSNGAASLAIGPRELADLRAKYEEMRRLRIAHAAGETEPPRRAMAALAAQFPGALREIDELPLAEIQARITSLGHAEAGRIHVTMWMQATALFHAFTRGALSVKRWLAGRKDVDAATLAAFALAAPTLDHAEDARAWTNDVHRIARPPRGRVTDLVYERIGEVMRVTPREARILVFGLTRRERRAPHGTA